MALPPLHRAHAVGRAQLQQHLVRGNPRPQPGGHGRRGRRSLAPHHGQRHGTRARRVDRIGARTQSPRDQPRWSTILSWGRSSPVPSVPSATADDGQRSALPGGWAGSTRFRRRAAVVGSRRPEAWVQSFRWARSRQRLANPRGEATVNGGENDDHSRRIAVLEATVKEAEQRAEAAAVAAGKLITRITNAEAAAKACTNFGR